MVFVGVPQWPGNFGWERIDTAEKRNTEDFREQPSIRGDPMSHKFHPRSRPASWGAPVGFLPGR